MLYESKRFGARTCTPRAVGVAATLAVQEEVGFVWSSGWVFLPEGFCLFSDGQPRQAGGKRTQTMSPALLGRQEAPTQTLPAVVTLLLTALSPEAGAPLIQYLKACNVCLGHAPNTLVTESPHVQGRHADANRKVQASPITVAPQIRLTIVDQEEKMLPEKLGPGHTVWPGCILHLGDLPGIPASVLACLLDAHTLAILAKAHPPDEHLVHQGHTPVICVGLLDACWTAGGPVVLQLAWHGPSRTYASHLPAPMLQAAYFRQSVGLSEGRSPSSSPGMVYQGPMHASLPLRCKQLASHTLLDCRRAGHPTATPGECLYTSPTAPHFFFVHYWADCRSQNV
ncbi:hypothetical protein B0H14DRAFT_2631813 [Mycena olivaceomarginata]|nr:hypothetical protein B0H14DRAFT_2631813 [Mycena olivaceomarginata]